LELELEGLDFDEFEETFLELLAVGLSNVDPAAFLARNASMDIGS